MFRGIILGLSILLTVSAYGDPIGLKNFRQLPASYELVTGVSSRTPAVQAVYQKVKTRLPISGDVEEMSSPMLLATIELGGAYCNELLQQEVLQQQTARRVFSSVNFTAGPSAISVPTQRLILADLASTFWQRELVTEEWPPLLASFSEATNNSSTATDTQKVMHVLCTQFATSLEFLTR